MRPRGRGDPPSVAGDRLVCAGLLVPGALWGVGRLDLGAGVARVPMIDLDAIEAKCERWGFPLPADIPALVAELRAARAGMAIVAELRRHLDTLAITGENIGDLRR